MARQRYDNWVALTMLDIESEFEGIDAYLTTVDETLEQGRAAHLERSTEFRAEMDREAEREPDEPVEPDEEYNPDYDDDPPDLFEHHADEEDARSEARFEELGEEYTRLTLFGRILCNTTVASLCTFFELKTVEIATVDFHRRNYGVYATHTDLAAATHRTVGRYNRLDAYWTSTSQPYNSGQLWDDIVNIHKVRHKIMHTNGVLGSDGDSTFIRQLVTARRNQGVPGLRVEGNMIVADRDYCAEVLAKFKEFLMRLVAGVAAVPRPAPRPTPPTT